MCWILASLVSSPFSRLFTLKETQKRITTAMNMKYCDEISPKAIIDLFEHIGQRLT